MIPVSLPVEAVNCTSEIIRVDSRGSCESSAGLSLPNVRIMVVIASPSLAPLHRSLELIGLAEKVAAGLPETPDFSDDWIAHLVDDLSQFND